MTNRRDACVASWKPQSLYVAVSCCVGVDCYLLWGDWKMSYNQRWLPAISELICLSLYNTQYFRIPVSPLNSLLSIFKVEASQCCKCYVNGGLAPLMNSNDFCSCGRKITLKCFLFVTQFTCCFLANLMISRRVVWMKHFLVFFPPTVPPDMHVDTRPFVLFSLSLSHTQTNKHNNNTSYLLCHIFAEEPQTEDNTTDKKKPGESWNVFYYKWRVVTEGKTTLNDFSWLSGESNTNK